MSHIASQFLSRSPPQIEQGRTTTGAVQPRGAELPVHDNQGYRPDSTDIMLGCVGFWMSFLFAVSVLVRNWIVDTDIYSMSWRTCLTASVAYAGGLPNSQQRLVMY